MPRRRVRNRRPAKKFGAGVPINAIGESTYASTILYAKAVEKAGSVEPEKVIDAIGKIELEVPHGKLSINAGTHHARCGTIIAKVNNKSDFDVVKVTNPVEPVAGCSL